MKKFVSLLLVVMVLGAAFACTAWAEELEGEEFANPTYGYKVDDPAIVEIVTKPTCKDSGIGKLADGKEIEIDATGKHDFVVFTEEGNPCEEGYKVTYKCSVCGELKVVSDMVPVAHDWQKDEENSKEPTCSEVGKTYYKCSTCEKYKGKDGAAVDSLDKAEAEEVAMVPHTFEGKEEGYVYTSTESHPTCTKAGTAFDVCTKCGKLSDPITVAALGHNQYKDKEGKIDATLLADNYTKGTAKGDHGDVTCGSHSFDTYYCNACKTEKDGKITVEEGGKVVIYKTDEEETLPAHSWTEADWKETKAPTCAAEGEASRTCKVCKTVETRSIPKLAHTPVVDKDGEPVPTIVTAPTCEKEGKYTLVCSVCGEKFVTEEGIVIKIDDDFYMWAENGKIDALGHKWETNAKYLPEYDDEGNFRGNVWKVTKPATCTEAGEKQRTCERCGKVEKEKLAALGHDWNDWVQVVEPNTKNDNKGLWTRTCKHEGCKEVESYEGKAPLANEYTFPTVTITKTYNSTDEFDNRTVKYYGFSIVAETAPFKDYTITVTKDGAEHKDSDKWNYGYYFETNNGEGHVSLQIPADVYGTFEIKVTVTDNEDQKAEASITEVNAAPAVKNGLVAEDGTIRAYKDGKIDTSVNGLREFNGGSFVMKNGELDKSAEGLTKVGEDWYYCSYGQVHTDISQLVPYNGGWFFVSNGKLDRTKEGLVEYDGGKFIVSAGQVHYEYTGLWQDPATGTWAYYDHGQFWPSFSGEVEYDGVTFQVKDGLLAA